VGSLQHLSNVRLQTGVGYIEVKGAEQGPPPALQVGRNLSTSTNKQTKKYNRLERCSKRMLRAFVAIVAFD
jgi:hypothetical protein